MFLYDGEGYIEILFLRGNFFKDIKIIDVINCE